MTSYCGLPLAFPPGPIMLTRRYWRPVSDSTKRYAVLMNDFVIPLDDVPADVQAAITKWSQWIDYWAVDWDNHDDTFHNEWQSYRTRKSREIELATTHRYEAAGEYAIVIKVIDILGNDTTKAMRVCVH